KVNGAPVSLLTLGSNAILTGGKLKINGLAGTSDESRSVSTTIQVDPGDEVSISVSFVNGSEIIATGQVEGEFGLMNGSLLLDSKKTGVDPSGNLNINYTAVAKGSLEVYLKVSQYNGTDETPEFSYDNLSIAVTSTSRDVIVIQKDDYYPFGLTFQSWQLNPPKNQYGFQGQEYQEEIGWHQYKWRNADPALGRFFNVDPLAEKYHYWTPYAFSGNMVIRFVELEGLEPAYPDMQESLTQAFGRGALNFVTSTAESVWFLMKASNPYTLERQQLKKGINQGATGLFTFLADPASGLEAVASHADTEFETFRRASDQERAIMLTEFGGEVVAGAAFEGAVGPLLKSLDVAGDVAKITKSMDNIPGMSQADISKVLAGNWGGEFFYKGIGSQKAIDHIWDLHSFTNRQAGKSYFLGKYNSKGKLKNLVADARAKARSNHNAGILRDDGKRVFRVEMDGFIGVDRSGRQTRIMTIIEENGRYNNSFPGTL
ncbi:MAG: RHS repeat-associated core domain-containing protein, partial [Bacteroidota bacterium]